MNKISYVLSADEVRAALFTAGVLKPYKKKMIIIAIISAVLLITVFRPTVSSTYPIAVVLVLANVMAFFGYKKNEENTIRHSTTGEVTELTAYDEHINVIVQAYDADWSIFKDDVSAVLENDEEIVILLADGRLMALPKRVFNDENKKDFEKVLNYFSDINQEENKELGE